MFIYFADELGMLFYKHMTHSLSVTEFLQISNIVQDFNPIWEFQKENQNEKKVIRIPSNHKYVMKAKFIVDIVLKNIY